MSEFKLPSESYYTDAVVRFRWKCNFCEAEEIEESHAPNGGYPPPPYRFPLKGWSRVVEGLCCPNHKAIITVDGQSWERNADGEWSTCPNACAVTQSVA